MQPLYTTPLPSNYSLSRQKLAHSYYHHYQESSGLVRALDST